MRLYLVRHGETDWNREGRLQGSADVPLNENGIKLARLTKQKILHIPFDCAYSSPLRRAKETASLMLEGRNLPILIDDRLQEVNFGPLEGTYNRELRRQQHPILDFFEHPERRIEIEGAESASDVVKRAKDFIEDIVFQHENRYEHMAVFAHGALIHGMLTYAYQRDIREFWHDPRQENCAFSTIDIRHGEMRVLEEAKVYARI